MEAVPSQFLNFSKTTMLKNLNHKRFFIKYWFDFMESKMNTKSGEIATLNQFKSTWEHQQL